MGWYFSVALPDDPAPCHDATETLRSVVRAARDAADLLAGHAVLPEEDFGGLAARGYREASAALGHDARGVADDTLALAAALDDYAVRIAAVRRTLAGIREDALAQGYAITPQDRVESVPVAGTTVDLPFQRLEARATRAHAELESARRAWWEAVQDLTTGPLAAPAAFPYPPFWPPVAPPGGAPPGGEPPGGEPPGGEEKPPRPAPDTSAPGLPTGPASSYGNEAAPAPGAEAEAVAGPAGPAWHWAAIPLPPAPPVLHGEPLDGKPSPPCPTTFEGVLT